MILIRADANSIIGSGHLMRCLSVAHACRIKGSRVLFVTADHSGDSIIHSRDFESICLESDWKDLDNEIVRLQEVLRTVKPALLLVDSYFVSENYFKQLSDLVRTAYIDDINKARWQVDILINYNIFAQNYEYSMYNGTKLLLGPGFTPLRDEFRDLPAHQIKESEAVKDIFISAGGADPARMTERFLKQLCPEFPNVNFHFIVGAFNPRLEEIKKECGLNTLLHINEQHMSLLMKECDVAVSAAGSTLYELCAAGTPTITYVLADNQIDAAEEFAARNIMINAGDCRKSEMFMPFIVQCLRRLINDEKKRRSLSEIMQKLVDGKGSNRIAEQLCGAISEVKDQNGAVL